MKEARCAWEACGKAFYVRQFQPDDANRVKELFAQGLEEHVPALPVELQDEEKKYIKDAVAGDLSNIKDVYLGRIESPRGNFWVAVERDREIVQGIVGLEHKTHETAELRRMSVANDARRTGVGSRLVDVLLEFAAAEGYKRVFLTTGWHMPHAVSFYTSCRFKELRRYADPDTPGFTLVYLEKML